MSALAAAIGYAALAAGSQAAIVGSEAPDLVVKEWPLGPEVHLRNVRGRKAVVLFYDTAC
jgi:hypothetical protein